MNSMKIISLRFNFAHVLPTGFNNVVDETHHPILLLRKYHYHMIVVPFTPPLPPIKGFKTGGSKRVQNSKA